MIDTLTHYIGGERVAGDNQHSSINPSNTADIVARYPGGGAAEVDQAVKAARAAFPSWSEASPEVRADLLDKIGLELMARAPELGRLLSREEGKTLAEGAGEVMRAARIFRYFAGEALRRHGRTLRSTRPGSTSQIHREAVGVVGLITPWNFPIAIPAWKAAPALAFGNTVVLKPASPTPAIAAALAAIIHEAGAPAGVFNLVLGEGGVGAAIVDHEEVDAISFTGSQGGRRQGRRGRGPRQARVQLEMGGKNPLVILDDADLDRAVAAAADGGFFATGQRCTASSRVIVTEAIHDRFVAALAERAGALKVGDALDPQTQIGPAVSASQLSRTCAMSRSRPTKAAGWSPAASGSSGRRPASTWRRPSSPTPRPTCGSIARRCSGRWSARSGSRIMRKRSRSPIAASSAFPRASSPIR